MISRRSLLLASACGVLGCGTRVEKNDVIGAWSLTRESRQALPEVQRRAPGKIVLNSNGSFTALGVPEHLLYQERDRGGGVVTGTGTWSLVFSEG